MNLRVWLRDWLLAPTAEERAAATARHAAAAELARQRAADLERMHATGEIPEWAVGARRLQAQLLAALDEARSASDAEQGKLN